MRPFPRTPGRRLAAVALTTSLAASLGLPLAQADDLKGQQRDAQRDKAHVRGQISSAQHDLDESSARVRAAIERVTAAKADLQAARGVLHQARDKLHAARVRDREMQARLRAAESRLALARVDVLNGRKAVTDQSLAVQDMVNNFYQQGDPQLLALTGLLNSQTPADLTREAEARNVILGNETRAYDDLSAAEVLLKVREQQVEDATDAVEVARAEAAAHLVEMKQLEKAALAAKQQVADSVAVARDARQQARQARAKDRAALARLRAKEARIQRHLDHLAELAAQKAQRGGGYHGDTGGFLTAPVNGPVTSAYGWREHPIYHYWGLHDGDDFGAGCGAPLYAANTGTVMSEWYSSVWGNRLYLNLGVVNGQSVVAIYNHLSSYDVAVGERVRRGQVVGRVGTTGWSTGCHLHFTVLVNGKAVDPQNWL